MDRPATDDVRPDPLEELITSWLTLSEAADLLGVSPNKVRQLSAERQLYAVRTASSRELRVPAEMIDDGELVKNLGGTLTLLTDVGFDVEESLVWLWTPDETLPGRPIDALREDRGREVRRRAQAMA